LVWSSQTQEFARAMVKRPRRETGRKEKDFIFEVLKLETVLLRVEKTMAIRKAHVSVRVVGDSPLISRLEPGAGHFVTVLFHTTTPNRAALQVFELLQSGWNLTLNLQHWCFVWLVVEVERYNWLCDFKLLFLV
jgi:hypothetical protein